MADDRMNIREISPQARAVRIGERLSEIRSAIERESAKLRPANRVLEGRWTGWLLGAVLAVISYGLIMAAAGGRIPFLGAVGLAAVTGVVCGYLIDRYLTRRRRRQARIRARIARLERERAFLEKERDSLNARPGK